MPSIDPSRLPFLLFSLSVASPLFNLIRLLFLSLYPPTLSNLSLSACLPPSFCLHMHYQWHFLSFFPLSLFVKVSPSFLPSPFHLSHPPTLSPSSLSPSLPLTGVTGRSLWLSHRPPVSVLTVPFTCHDFFVLFCLFYEWWPSDRRRRGVLPECRGVASGNKTPLLCLKCVTMEICVNRAPVDSWCVGFT